MTITTATATATATTADDDETHRPQTKSNTRSESELNHVESGATGNKERTHVTATTPPISDTANGVASGTSIRPTMPLPPQSPLPSRSPAPSPPPSSSSSSLSLPSSDVVFRIRVIELDHYMSKLSHSHSHSHSHSFQPPLIGSPTSLFSFHPIHSVPIIRVWGRTPSGQRACVHVHGVFPYLYVNLAEEAWDTAVKLQREEQEEREREKEKKKKTKKNKRSKGRPNTEHLHPSYDPSSQSVRSPPPSSPPPSVPLPSTAYPPLHTFLSRFGASIERALRELEQADERNRRAAVEMGINMGTGVKSSRIDIEASKDDEANRSTMFGSGVGGGVGVGVGVGGDIGVGGSRNNGDIPRHRITKSTPKPYIHSMCVVRARSIYGYAPTERPLLMVVS